MRQRGGHCLDKRHHLGGGEGGAPTRTEDAGDATHGAWMPFQPIMLEQPITKRDGKRQTSNCLSRAQKNDRFASASDGLRVVCRQSGLAPAEMLSSSAARREERV